MKQLFHKFIKELMETGKFAATEEELKTLRAWVKNRANRILKRAVESGSVNKPEMCECCGIVPVECGHHWDYSKPLDVYWLCRGCHRKVHTRSGVEFTKFRLVECQKSMVEKKVLWDGDEENIVRQSFHWQMIESLYCEQALC